MNSWEYGEKAMTLAEQAERDSVTANTQWDRARVRDTILLAQFWATLDLARNVYIVAEQLAEQRAAER